MRYLCLALAIIAVPAFAATRLETDIAAADKACGLELGNAIGVVKCFTEHERAVWMAEAPQTLASYDDYAAQRLYLTSLLQRRQLGHSDYFALMHRLNLQLYAMQNTAPEDH